MKRTLSVTIVAAIGVLGLASAALPQTVDEARAVREKDWRSMLQLAKELEKNPRELDAARRKYQEAWTYAMSWAVYDPTRRDSGSQRANGLSGLRTIRDAVPPAGLDMNRDFDNHDQILAHPDDNIFSSPSSDGVWNNFVLNPFSQQLELRDTFRLRQRGTSVTGGTGALEFFGEFNGARRNMTVTIKVRRTGETATGTLTLSPNGNVLTGRASFPPRPAGGGLGDVIFDLRRGWLE